jgi:hypothetical protein
MRGGGLTVGLRTVVPAALLVCLAAVRVHKVRLAEMGWWRVRRGERWALDSGTWVAAAGVVGGCDAACVEFSICFCFGLECDLLQCVVGIRGIESLDNGQNGGGQEEEYYDGGRGRKAKSLKLHCGSTLDRAKDRIEASKCSGFKTEQ